MVRKRSQRTDRRASRRGLTLFEVLLSLAILAASIAAIGQLISSGVRSSVRARLQSEAIIRCESRLAELIATGDPTAVVTDQPFADDPAWKWSVNSTATEETGLWQLLVTVKHDPGNGFGDISFSIPRLYRDPLAMVGSSSTAATTGSSSGTGGTP